MTSYRWKPGVVAKVSPDVAGAELERLKTRHNGNLEPDVVWRAAQQPDNPLHDEFEWDIQKAAERHWTDHARYLIRSIEVVIQRPEQEPSHIRAFVSIERDKERTYTSTADALADPELRRQVVNQAWRELEAWRQRHAELVELARVFTVIDEARDAE